MSADADDMFKSSEVTTILDTPNKNIILAINDVESSLVRAVKKLSEQLNRPLKGIVLIDKNFADFKNRVKDTSGFFEEIICDFSDPESILDALNGYKTDILTYCCRYEWDIKYLEKAAPYIPYISLPNSTSLRAASQKNIMRDRLHNYDPGLVPKYFAIEEYSKDKVDNIIQDMTFPVIIKPAGLDGSQLVKKCDSPEILHASLENAFLRIESIYEEYWGRGEQVMLIEEFMEGDLYSVDAYVDSLGNVSALPPVHVITHYKMNGEGGFAGAVRTTAHNLDGGQISNLYETVKNCIHALNLQSSVAHIELYLTDKNEWKIVEIAARIGGYREDLYREAYGIDHYLNYLRNNINLKPTINKIPIKYATAINIHADKEGYIERVEGLEEANKLESAIWIKQYMSDGEMALLSQNGGFYIAHGILANEDKDQLTEDTNLARDLVKVQIRQ
jgi:biotin carboxylase